MKEKHINIRIEQCISLSKASNCPRRKVGALLLDPVRNVLLMDGYNGGPRGGGELCGGDCCLRDSKNIESGKNVEIGCHHAEMNVICNAAANGIETKNSWMFITHPACYMCAKLIHHAGIKKVIVIKGLYSTNEGLDYLVNHGVEVSYLEKEHVLEYINKNNI